MMYQSSKGAVEISTMPLRYASNALSKLQRDEPSRRDEIDALAKHVAALAEQEENPRVAVGDNNPPADEGAQATPSWQAIKINMDDLLEQARGISGVEITAQPMADQAGQLLRDLQEAARLADATRVAEKAPFDKAAAEIQDRYNEYIAPIKNKKPGLVSKAEMALKNQIGAWLKKLDDEKQEKKAAAMAIADKAAADALAAHAAAKVSDDIDIIDAAEDLMAAAEDAARELKLVENEKVQARGDYRAIGLRSTWKAVRIDGEGGKSLMHYAKTRPLRVIEFIQMLADEDVKAGIRAPDAIPGFTIVEEKVV